MNLMTIAVGIAMIVFGVVTMFLRSTRPEAFRKLQPMQEFWGKRAGYLIHVLAYSVVPAVAGAVFVYRGLQGQSLF